MSHFNVDMSTKKTYNYVHVHEFKLISFNTLLTPRSRFFLQTLTDAQMVKKFSII
jgi:hypothetical protein